ncbi:MAG: outer membrane beta-barrel protein, partial [Terriglobia bacterium]
APAAAAAPAAPAALPTPSITGPLSGIPPLVFDAGPFHKLSVNGIVSGFGMAQGDRVPGDKEGQADLSNGQVWIQKTDGWLQFYVQAGAYNLQSLGTPFVSTSQQLINLYGPVPTAYLKLVPTKTTSILIGELPTLIGAEYTFSFENMNIERGLLWNQENAITRGIQLNQAIGKYLALSFSLNDGFYSNRYTWLSGSLTYTKGAHALSFVAGGNYKEKNYFTPATPIQNDGSIYNVIYTFTKGPWIIQPYFQYTDVPTNTGVGVTQGASTKGGAILVSHAFKHGFSLAGRWEYIASTSGTVFQPGTAGGTNVPLNLLFGPGSSATSVTVTPTFQYGGFFVRGDVSWVHAIDPTPGDTFGPMGMNNNQPRALAEIGFMFGDNIVKK